MMTNEERIRIFDETKEYINNNCREIISNLEEAIVFDNNESTTDNSFETQIIVDNVDSFDAVLKHNMIPLECAVLNFANAYHPGGAVTKGYSAQEEELCRRSSLYLSLTSSEASRVYDMHNECRTLFNSDKVILSPDVLVVRDVNYSFLKEPFHVAVVTMAAPNMNSIQCKAFTNDLFALFAEESLKESFMPEMKSKLIQVLEHKVDRMLNVMLANGYKDIVLGAWGAGAFGNNAYDIACVFKNVLQKKYKNSFRKIVFAVLDKGENKIRYSSFEKVFGNNAAKVC